MNGLKMLKDNYGLQQTFTFFLLLDVRLDVLKLSLDEFEFTVSESLREFICLDTGGSIDMLVTVELLHQ